MKKILFIILMAFFGLSLMILETGCPAGNGNICELPAPDSLTATPVSNTSVKLDWNPVAGAVGYNAKIYVVNGSSLTLAQTEANANPGIIFNGLSPNTLYEAVVRSNCANNISSNDSSVVQFRLGILIEDVVMIDLKPKEMMVGMQDTLCENTDSESMNISGGDFLGTSWIDKEVYELNISDGTGNEVVFKVGYNATTVQYLDISHIGFIAVPSTSSIAIKDSGLDIGSIVFSTGVFTIKNLKSGERNDLTVRSKKCKQ